MVCAQHKPACSIILPTYNRAAFLPQAIESILGQTFTDWELILIDDGSTDDTAQVFKLLTKDVAQPIVYHRQDNGGAYAARNAALDRARGRYIAFYDSDDTWLEHHLQRCVGALETHRDVDWVFGSCRRIDMESGAVLTPNTFYQDGRPRPFMQLGNEQRGDLRVIDDPALFECRVNHGLYCGPQVSVLRAELFDNYRFDTRLRNEAEDQLLNLWAILHGKKIAYFEDIHVIYRVHGENSSASAKDLDAKKHLRVQQARIERYLEVMKAWPFSSEQVNLLTRRLADDLFWIMGYQLQWMQGRRRKGLQTMSHAMKLYPWSMRRWKTFLLAWARTWGDARTAQQQAA